MESLKAYFDRLGSVSVSPGGGSAAALVAAAGTALIEMVSRLNTARDKKKGLRSDSKPAEKLKTLRKKLLALMTEDERVFAALTRFPRTQRESPAYQKTLLQCAKVPMQIAEISVEALEYSVPEMKKVSKWLVSDLYEAELLLVAALRSAKLSVKANLSGIKDPAVARKLRVHVDSLETRLKKTRISLLEAAHV